MMMNDEEAFLQTLLDAGMNGPALVFAKARGLNTEKVPYEKGEMKKDVSEGKKLTFKPRNGKIANWPFKPTQEINFEDVEPSEKEE